MVGSSARAAEATTTSAACACSSGYSRRYFMSFIVIRSRPCYYTTTRAQLDRVFHAKDVALLQGERARGAGSRARATLSSTCSRSMDWSTLCNATPGRCDREWWQQNLGGHGQRCAWRWSSKQQRAPGCNADDDDDGL